MSLLYSLVPHFTSAALVFLVHSFNIKCNTPQRVLNRKERDAAEMQLSLAIDLTLQVTSTSESDEEEALHL